MTTGVTQYAYQALDAALDAVRPVRRCNTDEIADLGPAWACAEFGRPGHDYGTCGLCHANYQRHLRRGTA